MTKPFLCDAMLGTLAKLMRTMGLDTAYATSDLDDDEVLAWAHRESRVLVTRDYPLSRRAAAADLEAVLVRDLPADQQVKIILTHLGLAPDPDAFFSRCIVDNGTLQARTVGDVRDRVPPRVLESQERFTECPECGRVYWPGTHVQDMDARLRTLVASLSATGDD